MIDPLLEKFVELMRDAHEYRKSPHSDNPNRCERCREYVWINTPLKLCNKCQDQLKENYPEVYEQARLENMRLYDESRK